MSDETTQQNGLHLTAKEKTELSVKLDNLLAQMRMEVQKIEQAKKVSESLVRV